MSEQPGRQDDSDRGADVDEYDQDTEATMIAAEPDRPEPGHGDGRTEDMHASGEAENPDVTEADGGE